VRQYRIELTPDLLPLRDVIVRDARVGLVLLFGVALTTLLLVCVNVGNLMLVRSASRDREVGVRLALGSSRRRLFFLVMTEAMVLVGLGAAVGVVTGIAALKAFAALAPPSMPRLADIHVGLRVWAITLGAAAASVFLCGLVPAWRMSRTDPQGSLR